MRKGRAGFTLVELMIAAAILAVALVGLLGVFIGSFGLIELGRNLTIAVDHARCVMEEIRDCNIPSFVTLQDWAAWAQADVPGGGGCNILHNESVEVTYPSGTEASPLEIMVRVSWTENSRPRSVQLVTLLAER